MPDQDGETIMYRLDETKRTLTQEITGQERPEEYLLENLLVAHVLFPDGEKEAPVLILILVDPSKGGKTVQKRLTWDHEGWTEICTKIEQSELPKTLAKIWLGSSPFKQYQVLIMNSEVGFLRGKIHHANTCLAGIRAIFSEPEILIAFIWIFIGLFLSLLLFSGIVLTLFGVDLSNQTVSARVLAIPLGFALLAWAFSLFRPLSKRLESDTLGQRLADRLINSRIQKKNIEHLLDFIKDDIDRVRQRYELGSLFSIAAGVASAASGLLPSVPKFVSGIIPFVATLAFFLYKLYYSSHIQILQLAKTACLIAKAQIESGEDK